MPGDKTHWDGRTTFLETGNNSRRLFAQVEKKSGMFLTTAEKLALVFFAQERGVTLTWSIAGKYIGHFFCTGTQCSGILFSAEKRHLDHQM
jgi:hypothetical protein